MLDYDDYKERGFIYPSIDLKPFDGGVYYECSGGEGIAYNEEYNNLIPKRYRKECGSYELVELEVLEYFFAPEKEKHKHLKDKLELDLSELISRKWRRLEAPYRQKIAELEAEMENEVKAAIKVYKTRAKKKLNLTSL